MNNNCHEKTIRALHWFAVLTAVATFLLLGAGRTGDEPRSRNVRARLAEQLRLQHVCASRSQNGSAAFSMNTRTGFWASAVGLMTTILAVWLWLKDSRQWMKWLGVAAFLCVVAQGVLGGLRVALNNGQSWRFSRRRRADIFCLDLRHRACSPAGFGWNWRRNKKFSVPRGLRSHVLFVDDFDFSANLILGATMRHQHAGLVDS